MTPRQHLVALVAILLSLTVRVDAEDWITAPSYYTHDGTGRRVQQHTPIGPFYTAPRDAVQRSGYHHTRSSLQFGGSVDHYHLVEEWGRPVRPYDEWRFPFRPYAAPYPDWGPPFGGLGGPLTPHTGAGYGQGFGVGLGMFPFFPFALPLAGVPGMAPGPAGPPPPGMNPAPPGQPPFPPGGAFPPAAPGFFPPGNPAQRYAPYRGYQPWFDDRYPAFDDRAPWRYEPFPRLPDVP